MTWRRLILLAAGTLTLAIALGGTGGAAAGPAKAKTKCPDDHKCVWTEPHYQGKRLLLGKRKVSNQIYNFHGDPEGPFNDTISSVKVRKKGIGVLYANVNGDGESRCFNKENRNVPDLADPAWNFDNSASSSAIPRHDAPCLVRKSGGPSKGVATCPPETLCVWSKKNYKGQKVRMDEVGEISNKLADKMNNDASSLINSISSPGTLYAKRNGNGNTYAFCDDESVSNLGGESDFNNRASSSSVGNLRAKRICRRTEVASKASGKKCADGALCVWTGKNYKGTKYKITEPGNIVNLPGKVNNKVSSAKNRWVNKAFLYEGKGGNGQPFCFGSGENVGDFSAFVDPSNNKFSSAFLDEVGGICPP